MTAVDRVDAATGSDLLPLLESFKRHLRAKNRSPRTVQSYEESVRQFAAFLHDRGMPELVASLRREHVESWIEHLLATFKPATAAVRFRSLQQFFRWLLEEGEIERDPMERMTSPRVPDEPPPVLTTAQLKAILKACAGNDFEARRDLAIVSTFIDTGARLGEVTTISVDDVDLDAGLVRVVGKGSKVRFLSLGSTAIRAYDRYLRRRPQHPAAASPKMWLGSRGVPMTSSGISQMVERRAEQAGIGHVNVHRFRHTFAHRWLAEGGGEGTLESLAGWSGPAMARRYGRSAAHERAIDEHKRMSPLDRL